MKKLKVLLVLVAVISLYSCKKTDSSYDEEETTSISDEDGNQAYPDGTYCADVDYYNPDTGTRSTYTLNVEVEGNEVVRINFSSGWLDSSEFSSEVVDSGGSCSITGFDGRQFDIQITGPECSNTDSVSDDESVGDDENINNDDGYYNTIDNTSDDDSATEEEEE